MVAFTHQSVIKWLTKEFDFVTAKTLDIKNTRKNYQNEKEKKRKKRTKSEM